ncbi:MAG TPA: pyrroline-5-carboxylate reductase [Spirochaetes bacterium]|nr:pyrroline-5-carboxylate reductase [Spirochaetota bacterium]
MTGVIGVGNMGAALVSGLAHTGARTACFDLDREKLQTAARYPGVVAADSPRDLAGKSDIIVVAVKPDAVAEVLNAIKDASEGKIIISIAAGVNLATLARHLGPSRRIFRAMPNTPALVGESMTVIAPAADIDDGAVETVKAIFASIGKVLVLPEKAMDAVTGLSGSGPAYVFAFIQALTDGGVKMGIPRAQALTLAAQTVLGAARMVLETGDDPALLRGRVTSPGGTTIEGLHVMERSGFSGIVMDAVEAAALKSRRLGEGK